VRHFASIPSANREPDLFRDPAGSMWNGTRLATSILFGLHQAWGQVARARRVAHRLMDQLFNRLPNLRLAVPHSIIFPLRP